jgi:cytochrome c oxidase cbb3-type subunit 3
MEIEPMNDEHKALLMDHEADGIQELDNLLPRWWLWLFYITIIFSVIYMGYFHVFHIGGLQIADYEDEMAAAALLAPAAEAAAAAPTEPSLDEATLAAGEKVFTTHCLACHRQDGGGLVGPNFCDDYFIHGPTFADSVRIVNEGVPAKGMIPWKPILPPDQIHAVCSYIWNLRGTNPENPKAPEGEKFEG